MHKKVKCFAQCHSAGKWWSHYSNHGKSGFRVCNELPSSNLLLDAEAGNAHDQINDRITDFVLNIQSVLYTVNALEVCGWQRMLWVAICSGYRTLRIQKSNSNLYKQRNSLVTKLKNPGVHPLAGCIAGHK